MNYTLLGCTWLSTEYSNNNPVDKEVVIYPSDKHPLKNRGLSISNWGSSTVVTNGRFILMVISARSLSVKTTGNLTLICVSSVFLCLNSNRLLHILNFLGSTTYDNMAWPCSVTAVDIQSQSCLWRSPVKCPNLIIPF